MSVPKKATKTRMPETMYRASRCCRALGNPTAYLIVRCLGHTRKTPSEISAEIETPLSTVSMTLRHLRELDLVRYRTCRSHKEYWLKDPCVALFASELEQVVDRMRGVLQ